MCHRVVATTVCRANPKCDSDSGQGRAARLCGGQPAWLQGNNIQPNIVSWYTEYCTKRYIIDIGGQYSMSWEATSKHNLS